MGYAPERCYSVDPVSGDLIMVMRGIDGYFPVEYLPSMEGVPAAELAARFNLMLGVSKPMEMSMVAGSMFGWDAPAADPGYYEMGVRA